MTDPIQTLREVVNEAASARHDRMVFDREFQAFAQEEARWETALSQVENLVRAAQNALPCVDRNATFPAQMLADARAPFKDTP